MRRLFNNLDDLSGSVIVEGYNKQSVDTASNARHSQNFVLLGDFGYSLKHRLLVVNKLLIIQKTKDQVCED